MSMQTGLMVNGVRIPTSMPKPKHKLEGDKRTVLLLTTPIDLKSISDEKYLGYIDAIKKGKSNSALIREARVYASEKNLSVEPIDKALELREVFERNLHRLSQGRYYDSSDSEPQGLSADELYKLLDEAVSIHGLPREELNEAYMRSHGYMNGFDELLKVVVGGHKIEAPKSKQKFETALSEARKIARQNGIGSKRIDAALAIGHEATRARALLQIKDKPELDEAALQFVNSNGFSPDAVKELEGVINTRNEVAAKLTREAADFVGSNI